MSAKPPVAEKPLEKVLKAMAGIDSSKTLSPEDIANLSSCALKYAGAFIMLIISGITIYVASTDDKALTDGFFKYMVLLIIPIIIGSALVLPIFSQKITTTTLIRNVVIFVVFILAIYYFYQTKNPESVLFAKYALYLIVILGLIVGLAIAYKIGIRYIYNSRGWVSVIFQILFFVPCLLLDLIEYIKGELRIAPNTVYVLFGIEICIVLAYYWMPRLYSAIPKSTTNVLMNDPVFLNYKTQVADYKALTIENVDENPFTKEYQYRVNYAVSFWAYMNSATTSTPVRVFQIGASSSRGKPLITFTKGKYNFYLSEGVDVPHFSMSLPIQKWNHFAISYNDHKVDIFINGNLEKTHIFDNDDSPNYSVSDVIAVGSDQGKNNVGAICNIRYYKSPISKYEIVKEYNLLMYKNPPVQ